MEHTTHDLKSSPIDDNIIDQIEGIICKSISKIQNDPLISCFKNSKDSEKFVTERILEIFRQGFSQGKKKVFSKMVGQTKRLNQKCSDLQSLLKSELEDKVRLSSQKEGLQRQLIQIQMKSSINKEKNQQVELLMKQVQKLEHNNSELMKENSTFKYRINESEQTVRELEEDISHLHRQIDELEDFKQEEMDQVYQEVREQFQQQLRQEVDSREDETLKLRQEFEEQIRQVSKKFNKTIHDLKIQKEDAQNYAEDLENRMDEMSDEKINLKKLSIANSDLQKSNEMLEEFSSKCQELEFELQQKSASLESITTMLDTHIEDLSALKQKEFSVSKEAITLKQQVTDFEVEVTQLKDDNSRLTLEVSYSILCLLFCLIVTNLQVTQLRDHNQTLSKDLRAEKRKKANLERDFEQSDFELSTLKEEKNDLEKRLNSKIERLDSEKDKINQKMAELTSETNNLVEEMRNELKDYQKM